jgi:plastocyanin
MAALAAAAASLALAPAAPAAGPAVQMVDNEPDLTNWHFDPADVTVPAGSTVVWHNRGHEEHSVTADDNTFDSGLKKQGTDFQWTFARAGVYAYHCRPHPWMTGRIHVVAGAAPPPVSSAAQAPPATSVATAAAAPTTTAPALTVAAPVPAGATPPPAGGGTPAPEAGGSTTTTAKPVAGEAAPAGRSHRTGGHVVATIALVLGLTLAGLAVGAKLRQSH